MIYTLTLNPALDYFLYVNSMQKDELNIATRTTIYSGGKGINVSKVLHNLGVPVINLGYLGGFSGYKIKQELDTFGIEHKFVNISEDSRINLKIRDASDNTETEIAGIAPIIEKTKQQELIDFVQKQLKDGDFLVCSGSIQSSLPSNFYKYLVSLIDKNINVVLDTRGNNIKENLTNNFLIKPNIVELEEMLGTKLSDINQVIKACDYFLAQGVKNIIISMGKEGSLFVNSKEIYHAAAIQLEVVNLVGAGDSMVAGFIAGITMGLEISQCYKMAIASACATISNDTFASKEDIEKFLSKICVNTIH